MVLLCDADETEGSELAELGQLNCADPDFSGCCVVGGDDWASAARGLGNRSWRGSSDGLGGGVAQAGVSDSAVGDNSGILWAGAIDFTDLVRWDRSGSVLVG